jgi:hypothetical protein
MIVSIAQTAQVVVSIIGSKRIYRLGLGLAIVYSQECAMGQWVTVTVFRDVCIQVCSSWWWNSDYRDGDGGIVDADLACWACVSSRQRGRWILRYEALKEFFVSLHHNHDEQDSVHLTFR